MKQLVVVAATAASLVLVAPAAAITGFGAEFRVSTTVSADEPNRGAFAPQAANNPVTGETFVVWSSDQVADNQFEVSGQMLAADGSDAGGDFVISSLTSTSGAPAVVFDVAVDSEHDRYLVVYSADDSDAGTLRDIWARLYDGSGTPLTGQVRVPFFVYGASQEGFVPHAAYNAVSDQWLVTWSDNRVGSARTEVYGRALNVDGAPQGTEDLVISERSAGYASQGGASYNAVAVSATGEYFVTFMGSRHPDPAGEREIWLQRLTSALAPTPNGTDVQVSDTTTGGAGLPSMAYDPTSGNFLVAYETSKLLATEGVEVLARVIDGTGSFVTDEIQVSNNPPGSITHEADVAAGGGKFAVEFLRFVSGTAFAPYVQEVGSDGSMIDEDTLLDAGGFLFGDVVRSGDRWLGLYPRRTTASHSDVFARFSGTGGPPPPPPPPDDDDDDPPPSGGGSPAPPAATPPAPPPPSGVAPPLAQRPVVRAPSLALPAFARVVTLPSTRRCASRRNFRIRLRVPSGLTATSAEVSVNGRRVNVVRGRRLTAPVDLRSLPKGRFVVKIVVRLSDGRRIEGTRRYRTCTPKRRRA